MAYHSHRGRCYFEPNGHGYEFCTVANEDGLVIPLKRRSKAKKREVTMYGSNVQIPAAERLASSSGPCLVSLFLVPFMIPGAVVKALRSRRK